MDRIGASNWAKYKAAMMDAHDSFAQDIIIWKRWVKGNISMFNEQPVGHFVDIELRVLMFYNSFRTWPITYKDVSGDIPNNNVVVMINREYLGSLGYLTPKGQFDYDGNTDYFVHRGKKYKPEGDTLVSQAFNDPMHVYVILREEEAQVATNILDQ